MLLIFAVVFVVGVLGKRQDDPGYKVPSVEVIVHASNSSLSKVFAEPAAFGGDVWKEDEAPLWELEVAGTLCDGSVKSRGRFLSPLNRQLDSTKRRAVLAERGGCSFSEKAANAEDAGFGVLLVRNTIPAMYESYAASVNLTVETLPVLRVARCDTDCRKTSKWIPSSEVTLASAMRGFECGCSFGRDMCVLTGDVRNRTRSGGSSVVQEHRVCCAADDLVVMGASSSSPSRPKPSIRLSALTISGGRSLATAANRSDAVTVTVRARPFPPVDPAVGLLWIVALTTVTVGSWVAARRDRMRASRDPVVRAAADEEERDAEAHGEVLPEAITLAQGLCFLGIAATFLMMLFLLMRLGIGIVYIFLVLFVLGTATAVSVLLVHPFLKRFGPASWQVDFQCLCRQTVNAAEIVGWLVGLSLGLVWFFFRHTSSGWMGQNVFAALLCIMFFSQIKLSSLRVAVIMGGLFVLYDVFMVFLTPYIFGSSIMVDVATAGRPESVPNQYCHCRLHPDDSKRCGPGEVMPILLRAPRLVDYRGGESLLGLGDIVIPGLVLGLALRHDYFFFKTWAAGAWISTVLGYAVGLSLANIAVVAMKQGQPALLYLLPMVLAALCILSHARGTLPDLWRGIQPRARDGGPLDDSELPLALAGEQRDVERGNVASDEARPLRGGEGRGSDGNATGESAVHRTDRSGSGGAFHTGEPVQVELTAFSPEERDTHTKNDA